MQIGVGKHETQTYVCYVTTPTHTSLIATIISGHHGGLLKVHAGKP